MLSRRVVLTFLGPFALLACPGGDPGPSDGGITVDAPMFPTSDQITVPDIPASDPTPDDGPSPDIGVDTPEPECQFDSECPDDGLGLCERTYCSAASGQCVVEDQPDGADCAGQQGLCVQGQVCSGGLCQPGTPTDCADTDPCTDDICDPVLGCLSTPIPDCCAPQCEGKTCGSDGCGGVCGECGPGVNCVPPGVCDGACVPDCADKECGDDGCGDVCGNCPSGWSCGSAGMCELGCTADCTNKECGDDGCGDVCGNCPGGWSCGSAGMCELGCTGDCTNKECGDDGCGQSCGTCPGDATCDSAGVCQVQCTPDCLGKECGDDGCGDVCGTCPSGWFCDLAQQCVDTCTPDCTGKDCGNDGCGGECGPCAGPEVCQANSCVDPTVGSTCANAFTVGTLPFTANASTSAASDDFAVAANSCPGEASSFGGASNDHVYLFTASDAGNYHFQVSGFDAGLSVAADCGDVSGTCLGGSEIVGTEEVIVWVNAGQTVAVVVDGWSNISNVNGDYTLSVDVFDPGSCTPSCTGKACGADGCGGQCGSCAAPQTCTPSGVCAEPGTGNTCSMPYVIPSVPASAFGDTGAAGSTNDNQFSSGACPGVIGSGGGGSADDVYSLTVATSGNYHISLTDADFAFDSVIYVASDCGDVGGSCIAAADDGVSGGDETLVLWLDAGTEYFIVVDGYSNSFNEAGTYTLNVDVYDPGSCAADCADKECGADGCGGQCGVCNGAGTVCTPSGICGSATAGDTCADPYVLSGALPKTLSGDTGSAQPDFGFSASSCPGEGSSLGGGSNDEVYQFTPAVSGNYEITLDASFDSLLYVANTCTDIDGSCLGAADTFGVETLVLWLEAGEAYFIYVDGYSDFSNYSGSYDLTVQDYDPGSCTPSCAGKACGSDGCGGQCGVCNVAGEACSPAGLCEPLGAGDDCATPYLVSGIPSTIIGDTSSATPSFGFESGECPGASGAKGDGSRDHVYAVTPTVSGNYQITLDPTTFDAMVYVSSVCGDFATSCLGADDGGGTGTAEEVILWLNAGETYFVYVDGYSNFSDLYGGYELTIQEYDPACTAQCSGLQCGPDGCGGQCGVCAPGTEQCSPAGQCEPLGAGDTCASPYVVNGVPVSGAGSTAFASNDFNTSAGVCAKGDSSALGGASADHVYAFTPAADGNYQVSLDPGNFDAALYVVLDCGDVDGSCQNAADAGGTGTLESLVEYMSASLTYYIVVDGYSNFSNYNGDYTLSIDVYDPGACSPTCAGAVCGDDGCGGYCGTCLTGGEACVGGTCVSPDVGATCDAPIVISSLPYAASNDSSIGGLNYIGKCPGGFSGTNGTTSQDQVYAFTADGDATLRVTVDPTESWDGIIYVATDCDAISTTCVGGVDGAATSGSETLDFPVTSGTTYYIFVDGYSDVSDDSGTYDLTVDIAP